MADLSKYYDKAEKALQKGKPEAALFAYLDALEEDSKDERSRSSAADLYITLGETHKAYELQLSLLTDFLNSNDSARAVPAFRKLLHVGKPRPETAAQYALLIEKTNKKESLEGYDLAVRSYQSDQRYADAVKSMERIVALDPRAETYKRYGELAELAQENKIAANAYVQLALLQDKAGFDSNEAYEKSYKCDPTNQAAILGHGRCLVGKGRADEAIKLLEPIANYPSAPAEAREPYTLALIAAGRILETLPFIWELFEKNPQEHTKTVGDLIAALLDAEKPDKAIALANKIDDFQRKQGRRREFVAQMKDICTDHGKSTEFLEYMAELYNANNREQDYCETLGRLFDLYYAVGNFIKAGDSLERAVDVDAYEPGHKEKLEMLRGKLDINWTNNVGARLGVAERDDKPKQTTASADEPTVLEDLVLQAEIFLQYGMRLKASEKVERIFKLFPHEEEANERVKNLYQNAGFFPKYADAPKPAAASAAAPSTSERSAPVNLNATGTFQAEDLMRAGEINRNIARQANPKGVLFAAVNDLGRGWIASRCLAGLATPGKPPSAALEYCAPGTKPSDVTAIVKLLMGLQAVCIARGGTFSSSDARNTPELASISDVLAALNIDSVAAIPLMDGDQNVGILILQQCGAKRTWKSSDLTVFQSVADQMVMAVNNARLRSLVKTLAVTDEKSGLLKRSSYLDVVLSEVQASIQQQSPLTLVLLNFGRTSSLVKEYGEPAIEQMMQLLGQNISSHVRQNDVAVRYDLTEIALLLSDTTEKNAFLAIEKLRRAMSSIFLPGKEQPPVLCGGIAEAIRLKEYDPVDIVTEVINRVEAALTISKAQPGGAINALPCEVAVAAT